ncbi:MAG: Yip1 family protein [Actinomycetota bacterium]
MDGVNTEWKEPPIPEHIRAEDTQPQMSEVDTLGNIFIDPGKTFEDLRRKPRFVLALLISITLAMAFVFTFYYKIGDENVKRFIIEQIDKNPRTSALDAQQKDNAIGLQTTIMKVVKYALPVIFLIITAIGGLLYWLGGKAFGGTGNYLHGVSVWVYSTFPPLVVGTIANQTTLQNRKKL